MQGNIPSHSVRPDEGQNRPENRLIQSYRISFGAVAVFTLTMAAVYFLSQEFVASYASSGFNF